eukprot:COSAG04_NODE_879_length_9676_cov_154.321499_2_plen_319_part_00
MRSATTSDPIQERREAFREAKAAAGAQADVEPTAGRKYRAVAKSAIRAGFDLDSDKLGSVKIGEVIEVIEARKTADGVFRVKFAQGWASLKGRSGKVLLEAAPDDATVSSIFLLESQATKDAKQEEAEAFLAAQQLDKTYEIKQKRNKVSVQLTPMALVVTQGKKPPTKYLYQTLTAWATTDKGFELTTAAGETTEFTCTGDEAEEICGGMAEKTMDLAKAASRAGRVKLREEQEWKQRQREERLERERAEWEREREREFQRELERNEPGSKERVAEMLGVAAERTFQVEQMWMPSVRPSRNGSRLALASTALPEPTL